MTRLQTQREPVPGEATPSDGRDLSLRPLILPPNQLDRFYAGGPRIDWLRGTRAGDGPTATARDRAPAATARDRAPAATARDRAPAATAPPRPEDWGGSTAT